MIYSGLSQYSSIVLLNFFVIMETFQGTGKNRPIGSKSSLFLMSLDAQDGDGYGLDDAVIGQRFNPEHPFVSRVYANVNLELGPVHWNYKDWNPPFGDITRYALCKWAGSGRYSDVFIGLQDGRRQCAVKLLKPVNVDRVRRELKVLSEVQKHKNVLEIWDLVIDSRTGIPAMVTPAVANYDWKAMFESFSLRKIKFYMYRLLEALAWTHSRGIMHRDVKPLNILCKDPRKGLVLADWGLAEFYHPLRKYSVHVCTKYYKAPEIFLGYQFYDYSVDIWSAGIILLEALSLRFHVFDAESNDGMICAMAKVFGVEAFIDWSQKYKCKLSPRKIQKISDFHGIPLAKVVAAGRGFLHDEDGLDLLGKMLMIDHKQRMTAEEALAHPFFADVRVYDELHSPARLEEVG
jgi:casein kinase II subunit alpha